MIGVLDPGGGMRGAYTAGIYDFLIDNGIWFDYEIGVSAGGANLVSYTARQRGRNLRFYTEYPARKEYAGVRNFLLKHSYLDMDYIYSTLSDTNGEDPVDFPVFFANPAQLVIVATDARTALPAYFTKQDMHVDDLDVLKASSSLPVACKPYYIKGIPYFDGGVSDPLPWRHALGDGCDKVVALLTRPIDQPLVLRRSVNTLKKPLQRWPYVYEALKKRYVRYNTGVSELLALQQEGRALVIAPSDIGTMKTLTFDNDQILTLYARGYSDASAIPEFISS